MRDMYHNVKVSQLLDPDTLTDSQDSAEVDMQGYDSLNVHFAMGESGDALSGSLKWTLKLQHSDTSGSGWEDVTAAETLNGAATITVDAAAEDDAVYTFGYNGGKRFVQAVATATGSHSNGTPMAILAVQGHANLKPTV
ncbi:MAG: hypothetical protein ACPG80_05655 [Rickettsiales bacterium]